MGGRFVGLRSGPSTTLTRNETDGGFSPGAMLAAMSFHRSNRSSGVSRDATRDSSPSLKQGLELFVAQALSQLGRHARRGRQIDFVPQ